MRHCFLLLLTIFSAGAQNAVKSVIDSQILFTADVYREFRKGADENFLVSPFSAAINLALIQSGAGGQTAQELRNSLHLQEQQNIQTGFKAILSTLTRGNQPYSLRIANRLYVNPDYNILEKFRKIAADVFGSDLENIDFSKNVQAAKKMNKWVEEKTENKIHDLISPEILDDLTVVVALNALYFHGDWAIPFLPQTTTKQIFYRSVYEAVQVDTMQESLSYYNYHESRELDAKFLEVPFEGQNASMIFVLPNKRDGLSNLETQIGQVLLPKRFTLEHVNVSIPKFKTESSVDIKEILKKLGVTKAFAPGQSDIRGITDRNLVISDVLQKTFIAVNEKGVEAAAATFTRLIDYSGSGSPDKQFHADHPFIYYIRVKNLVLFVGRVGLPTY